MFVDFQKTSSFFFKRLDYTNKPDKYLCALCVGKYNVYIYYDSILGKLLIFILKVNKKQIFCRTVKYNTNEIFKLIAHINRMIFLTKALTVLWEDT